MRAAVGKWWSLLTATLCIAGICLPHTVRSAEIGIDSVLLSTDATKQDVVTGALGRRLLQSDGLWEAASDGDLNKVKAAIEAGADLEQEVGDHEHTPLGIAALNGHKEVVVELLKAGAQPNTEDHEGVTALSLAAHTTNEHSLAIVELLLDAGADPNLPDFHGTVPLHLAAFVGSLEIVEALVAAGAEVDPEADAGLTPLILASQRGHADIVKFLLASGADPNLSEQTGLTPLHVVASHLGKPTEMIANALLDMDADVNAQSRQGHTPLNDASFFGNVALVRILLRRGADAGIHDYTDAGPLDVVCGCKKNDGSRRGPFCPAGGCDKPGTAKKIRAALV
eukprot:evm.model.scf_735EXC.5 EVM.evm.TU.scf_735EXC.5   scf_735EXC:40634-45634(+)